MASITEKFGLTLPAGSDYADIEILNENMRRIDGLLGGTAVTLTHTVSGGIHSLTGLETRSGIVQAVFLASADYGEGDTFSVDGVSYAVRMPDGEPPEEGFFVSGAAVSCILDTEGKKVNFKGGGGLSGRDLALGTAIESRVFLGDTFYAGGQELKTGAYDPDWPVKAYW